MRGCAHLQTKTVNGGFRPGLCPQGAGHSLLNALPSHVLTPTAEGVSGYPYTERYVAIASRFFRIRFGCPAPVRYCLPLRATGFGRR